jgi:L-ribulose-5-phosphate 3-epimerase/hexulose-6-phosphate isomerase
LKLQENKIGIYEKAIPNAFDWEQKIKVAKAAGFDFIEISVDESDARLARLEWTKEERQNLVKLLKENEFHLQSMCLSGHRRFPFGSKDEATRNKAHEIMDKAIELALDLGVKNIQLAGYDVYYEESTVESLNLFKEGLKYSAKKAEENNIMLTIEIMDTWLCGTISRAMEFCNYVGSDNLKVYPDLGNLTQWTDDPCHELTKNIDNIEAIHLKDTKPGVFKCVPFGEGSVLFGELFQTLRNLNYNRPFLIEMWADNDREYTFEESVNEIAEAKKWLYNRM